MRCEEAGRESVAGVFEELVGEGLEYCEGGFGAREAGKFRKWEDSGSRRRVCTGHRVEKEDRRRSREAIGAGACVGGMMWAGSFVPSSCSCVCRRQVASHPLFPPLLPPPPRCWTGQKMQRLRRCTPQRCHRRAIYQCCIRVRFS